MSEELTFDGKKYISAKVASQLTGYTKDYIGQLSRSGKIDSRMVGRARFVSKDDILNYKNELVLDGKRYITTKQAAEVTGYTSDYIGQLCRSGKVRSTVIGKERFVEEDGIRSYSKDGKKTKEDAIVSEPVQKEKAVEKKHTKEKRKEKKKRESVRDEKLLGYIKDEAPLLPILSKATKPSTREEDIPVPLEQLLELFTEERARKTVSLLIALTLVFGTYFFRGTPSSEKFAEGIRGAGTVVENVITGVGGEIHKIVTAVSEGALSLTVRVYDDGPLQLVRDASYSATSAGEAVSFYVDRAAVRVYRAVSALLGREERVIVEGESEPQPREPSEQPRIVYVQGPQTVTERVIEKTIERVPTVEQVPLVDVSVVTEEELEQRLSELTTTVNAELARLNSTFQYSPSGDSITGNPSNTLTTIYRTIALSNDIDNLGSVDISNSTFDSGSITNSSVAGTEGSFSGNLIVDGSLGVGTTSPYKKLSVAGDGHFDGLITASNLTATGTVSFTGVGTNVLLSSDSSGNIAPTTTPSVSHLFATSTTATSTFAGKIQVQKIPTEPHSFVTWETDAAGSNVLDASIVINPASASSDTNLFGIAVNDGVRFLVDAEGDVFANSLTTEGTTALSSTTISTLVVENSSTLGDATTTDKVYFNSRIGSSLIPTVDNVIDIGEGTTPLRWRTGYFGTSLGVGTTSPYARLSVHALTSDTYNDTLFAIASSTASATSTLFTVRTGGNVGIGTSTPGTLFSIEGNEPIITINNTEGSGRDYQVRNGVVTDGIFDIYDVQDAETRLMIDALGNLAIGSTTIPSGARVFIEGGAAGSANVDIRASTALETSTVEVQSNDYDSAVQSAFLQYKGSGVAGNIFDSIANADLGVIGFQNADNALIYTSNAAPIIFGTDFTERARVTATGEFGIGTTSPSSPFHIESSTVPQYTLANPSGNVRMDFLRGSATDVAQLAFGTNPSTLEYQIGMFNAPAGADPANLAIRVVNDNSKGIVLTSGGNVGIGTSSPLVPLEVHNANPRIDLNESDQAADEKRWGLSVSGSSLFGFARDDANSSGNNWLRVNRTGTTIDSVSFENGSVGIGTSSPSELLHITGSDNPRILIEDDTDNANDKPGFTLRSPAAASSGDWDFVVANNGNFQIDFTPTSGAELIIIDDTIGNSSVLIPEDLQVGTNAAPDFGLEISTTSANGYFGVTNSVNGDIFVIDSSGQVGIGTTTPYQLFSVDGDTVSANIHVSGISSAVLLHDNNANTDEKYVQLLDSAGIFRIRGLSDSVSSETVTGITLDLGTGNVGIGTSTPGSTLDVGTEGGGTAIVAVSGSDATGGNEGGQLNLYTADDFDTTYGFYFIDAWQDDLRIGRQGQANDIRLTSDGDLGVGTDSPERPFNVYDNDSSVLGQGLFENDGIGDAALGFFLTGTTLWNVGVDNSDSDKFKISNDLATGDLAVNTRLTIDTSGNVGIGDDAPNQKLGLLGTNTQISIEESDTQFLRAGVSVLDSIIGWDDADSLVLGTYASPTDTTITELLRLESNGFLSLGAIGVANHPIHVANFTNPQIVFDESATEFLRAGVGETANTSIVGWDDADSLVFGIYDSPSDTTITRLVTIDSTGKVAIGPTSPDDFLEIEGNLGGNGIHLDSSSGAGIVIDRGAQTNHYRILFETADVTEWMLGNAGTSNGDLVFYEDGSTTDRLTLQEGGFIGIGTTNPGRDLVIDKNSEVWISVRSSDSDTAGILLGDQTSDSVQRIVGDNSSNSLDFYTVNTERLTIDSSGLVGIGTTSPTHLLTAENTANADGFLFYSGNVLTGEHDVFTIIDNDAGGGGQDESSSFKVWRTGAISAASDGQSLVELTYTGGTADADEQFFILGRSTDEGAVDWGIALSDSDFWTTGSIRGGATGTDCAGTDAACFNSPTIVLDETGADSYIESTGDVLFSLDADTDNSGEEDNPRLELLQDGGTVVAGLGIVGSATQIYTNSTANTLYLVNDFASNIQLGTNNTAYLTITSSGDVGIGDNTPDGNLDVVLDVEVGSDTYVCIDPTLEVITSGGATCGGSSLRYKERIENLAYGLEDLNKLRPVSFYWKEEERPDDRSRHIGFIAEDVIDVIPEVVELNDEGQPDSVDYDKLTSLIVGAVQELAAKVTGLEERLTALEVQVGSTTPQTTETTVTFESDIGLIADAVASYFESLGVKITNGIVEFKKVFAENIAGYKFTVVNKAGADSSVGEGVIVAGENSTTISNSLVNPSSKIFVSFTTSLGTASWFISEKHDGGFTVSLSGTLANEARFDYWIIDVLGGEATGETEQSTAAEGGTVEEDTEPPTITINGNNPAVIEVGTTYSDLGVLVTDNVNENIGHKIYLDGVEVQQVNLDTSETGMHIVTYTATDQAGNTASAEREVIIYDENITGELPPELQNATTTEEIIVGPTATTTEETITATTTEEVIDVPEEETTVATTSEPVIEEEVQPEKTASSTPTLVEDEVGVPTESVGTEPVSPEELAGEEPVATTTPEVQEPAQETAEATSTPESVE